MTMVLIIASSGRMLAQAAKKSGLMPLVIDLFADLDTQDYAADLRQVKSLSEPDISHAVDYFIERYAVNHVIYGSGFESYPESLYYLSGRLTVLGNHPDVFAGQLNKQAFFATLDQLNIPHPELAFSLPETGDWLLKPQQGQGGVGIKHYHVGDNTDDAVYWQKFQTGRPQSALFLADGRQVQVIGFNSQESVRLSATQAFVFSGVFNNAELSGTQKTVITGWLEQLVPVFELKGLNSLDYIHFEDRSYVLEINPRPSASMQLYDEDLLSRHIVGWAGSFAHRLPLDFRRPTGYQIVYAEQDVIIPKHFDWPAGCMDLPRSGNICHTGQPICSIIAHQKDSVSVAELLLAKQQFILNKLERS
jgi:methenyltetrahydromethanopterin cyclohydrolase